MKRIVRNVIKCNHCGDIIISQHQHDFVCCSCFTEMSEFEENETLMNDTMSIIEDYNLNSRVITTMENYCHYMLIAYDAFNFYLFNLQENDILTVQAQWFNERRIQVSKEYYFLNKYINPKKLEVQENSFNITPLEHKYIEKCGNSDCGTCSFCTLTICKVCGGSEGSLTTECSGENNYQKDEDVYSGKLDFRYGKWREGICTRIMLWSPDKAIPNEIKYLQELLSENVPPDILKEECNYIAKWIDMEKGRIQ